LAIGWSISFALKLVITLSADRFLNQYYISKKPSAKDMTIMRVERCWLNGSAMPHNNFYIKVAATSRNALSTVGKLICLGGV
jgi:hypothetical protein